METSNNKQIITWGKSTPISLNAQQENNEKIAITTWQEMQETCKNRDDCFFGNHPKLSELNTQSGVCTAQILISTCLNLVNVLSNYKAKLSDAQIIIMCDMIYEKYFYLKETEMKLFFYDFYLHMNGETFFGSIEIKTIMNMLTKWVREKRGNAIYEHDRKLKKEKESKETNMNWKEYCILNGLVESESPLRKILSRFGEPKVPKDTKESTSNYAKALIENRFGFREAAIVKARRSFVFCYGCTPEEYLIKEGIYE